MMIDTSIIIDLFLNNEGSREFERIMDKIEDEDIFISLIQIGELSDWCYRNNINNSEAIGFIKSISEVLPIEEDIIETASRLKHTARSNGMSKFSLIDGMILSTARKYSERLLTRDNDFIGFNDVIVI